MINSRIQAVSICEGLWFRSSLSPATIELLKDCSLVIDSDRLIVKFPSHDSLLSTDTDSAITELISEIKKSEANPRFTEIWLASPTDSIRFCRV